MLFPKDTTLQAELNVFFEASLRSSASLIRNKNLFMLGFLVFKMSYLTLMLSLITQSLAGVIYGFYLISITLALTSTIMLKKIIAKGPQTARIFLGAAYLISAFTVVVES